MPFRSKVVPIAVGVATAVVWLLTASAGAADGVIDCGSVITEDTVLTHDLLDCENGLSVAASNVTIDLGGHQIVGRGTGVGVLLQDGTHGVSVKNGAIRSFFIGVEWLFAGPTLSELEIASNGWGVSTTFAGGGSHIENNIIHHNSGSGIALTGGGGNQILNNRIFNNGGAGIGLHITGQDDVKGNLVLNNGSVGVVLISIGSATVVDNSFNGNGGHGFLIDDPFCDLNAFRVGGNVANRNGGLGFSVLPYEHCSGAPYDLLDAGGNTAKHNGDPRECSIQFVCVRNRGFASTFAPLPPQALRVIEPVPAKWAFLFPSPTP